MSSRQMRMRRPMPHRRSPAEANQSWDHPPTASSHRSSGSTASPSRRTNRSRTATGTVTTGTAATGTAATGTAATGTAATGTVTTGTAATGTAATGTAGSIPVTTPRHRWNPVGRTRSRSPSRTPATTPRPRRRRPTAPIRTPSPTPRPRRRRPAAPPTTTPPGDSGGATTEDGPGPTDDGTGSSNPGECPPGYVHAGSTDPPATAEPPAETAGPGQDAEDEADDPGGEEDAAVEITFDAPRTPDDENPLKMYVGGDSISRDLGEGPGTSHPRRRGADRSRFPPGHRPVAPGLLRLVTASRRGAHRELSRRARRDCSGPTTSRTWSTRAEILDRFEGPSGWICTASAVDRIMTLLSQPDTQAVWIGQPPVRESRLSGGLAMLNAVYAEQSAERHPQVTFVDTWELFSGDGGGYVDEIDGVRLRREDGVHLTIAGGNHLAEAVWRVIGHLPGAWSDRGRGPVDDPTPGGGPLRFAHGRHPRVSQPQLRQFSHHSRPAAREGRRVRRRSVPQGTPRPRRPWKHSWRSSTTTRPTSCGATRTSATWD